MKNQQENNVDSNIAAFCNGNSNAIQSLYKKWSAELFFIAYGYLRNTEDAEDIVADAFEKLLKMPLEKRKQKFLKSGIDLKALLIVVVKNKSLDKIKVINNRRRIIGSIQHLIPRTTKNDVLNHFSDEIVESILLILPERERQMFRMTLQGYSREEIAMAFEVSLKTVSNTLSSSRSRLKEVLDDF